MPLQGRWPGGLQWAPALGAALGGENTRNHTKGGALWGKTAGMVMGATLGVMPYGGTVGTTLEPLWG